jgi:hypothetical protein
VPETLRKRILEEVLRETAVRGHKEISVILRASSKGSNGRISTADCAIPALEILQEFSLEGVSG